jgi:hypothetical protein
MKKKTIFLIILFILGIVSIPFYVLAEEYPQVLKASETEWGSDLDNIMITIHTNKDVDQIILNSGQGEFILSPETNYSEDDLRGNNEVMDMNGDLEVDRQDYEILKKHIEGSCKDYTATVRCSHCGAADINGDEVIDEADLQMLDDHITGKCSLEDCYFHGERTYREETEDGFTWKFHYTPTIAGTDTMTLTPQAVTSTGTRNGDVQTVVIKSEEYKNPKILRYRLVPNQNKYLIGSTVTVYAVTPLETDKVAFTYGAETKETDTWTAIDYDASEKTWRQSFVVNTVGMNIFTITGYGKQSNNGFIAGETVTFKEKVVDPQVVSTNRLVVTHVDTWTTSSTDDDGNVTTTVHHHYWYTITVTATCNGDTDYVVFHTPSGSASDYSYASSGGNRIFSTSWTSESSGETASANAYATIVVYPSDF